jgi:hypothetical protein
MALAVGLLIFLPILIISMWMYRWQENANKTKYEHATPGADVKKSFYANKNDFEKLKSVILNEPNVNWIGCDYLGSYSYSPKTTRNYPKGWFYPNGTVTHSVNGAIGWTERYDPVPEPVVFKNLKITPIEYYSWRNLMKKSRISSIEKDWALENDLGNFVNRPIALPPDSKIIAKRSLPANYKTDLSQTPSNQLCVSFEIYDEAARYQGSGFSAFHFYVDYLPLGDKSYGRRGRFSTFERLDGNWFLEKNFPLQRITRRKIPTTLDPNKLFN